MSGLTGLVWRHLRVFSILLLAQLTTSSVVAAHRSEAPSIPADWHVYADRAMHLSVAYPPRWAVREDLFGARHRESGFISTGDFTLGFPAETGLPFGIRFSLTPQSFHRLITKVETFSAHVEGSINGRRYARLSQPGTPVVAYVFDWGLYGILNVFPTVPPGSRSFDSIVSTVLHSLVREPDPVDRWARLTDHRAGFRVSIPPGWHAESKEGRTTLSNGSADSFVVTIEFRAGRYNEGECGSPNNCFGGSSGTIVLDRLANENEFRDADGRRFELRMEWNPAGHILFVVGNAPNDEAWARHIDEARDVVRSIEEIS